jgi:UPF0755 protein
VSGRVNLRRLLRAVATVLLGAFGLFVFWFVRATGYDRSLPAVPTVTLIPQGTSAREVADLLARDRVIASRDAFRLLLRLRGDETKMKAGEYRFEPHRTPDEVLHQLVAGGEQVAVWVTIPEGFTAQEIASTLDARGVGEAAAFETYFLTTPLRIDGASSKSLEGFLFPETYLVPVGATPAAVAKMMTDQFRSELPRNAAARAKHFHLSVPQVVTLASLVEREARADDERPLIAGVYYNRLRRGMPLQVDATIEYTFPHHKDVITYADLASDSLYNTYKHRGLPPTAIANPGRPSLWAAFYPRPSDYLYYVSKQNGHHAFSRTLAEHEANVARYLR